MTTPTPVTATLTFDQEVYTPGQTVTATVTYTDPNGTVITVDATANLTDDNVPPNTATATASFNVAPAATEAMTVSISDTANDVYVAGTATPGSAVFTTTAPSAL
jgi:hypothetical protein